MALDQQRSVALPWAALAVLAASTFAAITTEVLPVGLLPSIADGLHTSRSHVGLLVAAYAVVVAIGSVPLAAVLVRWPKRAVLCALLVCYAVSNAVFATTDSYWTALASRLFGGLVHAGFFSVVFAAAVAIAPSGQTGQAIAAVGVGNVVGLALGVPLGTVLGTAVGWRWAFAAAAVLLLVLAVVTYVVLPPTTAQESGRTAFLSAARRRPMVMAAVVVVVATLGHYTLFTYVSPVLLHAGVSRRGVGIVLLGYGAAGIIGLALAAAWADRRLPAARAGVLALTAACLIAIAIGNGSPVAVVVTVTVWGIAFGALPTLLQATALRAAPDVPDTAPAIVNAAFNVGISGGALLGAALLTASYSVLASAASALVLLSLVLAATMAGGDRSARSAQ